MFFFSQLEKMERRTKCLLIRLTPTEYKMVREKANALPRPNVSKLVRDAVVNIDPANPNKFKSINEMGVLLKQCTLELNHIGNNVNQIAHVLNVDLLNRLERLQANRDVQYEQITKQMEIVIAAINEIKRIELKIYKNVL